MYNVQYAGSKKEGPREREQRAAACLRGRSDDVYDESTTGRSTTHKLGKGVDPTSELVARSSAIRYSSEFGRSDAELTPGPKAVLARC